VWKGSWLSTISSLNTQTLPELGYLHHLACCWEFFHVFGPTAWLCGHLETLTAPKSKKSNQIIPPTSTQQPVCFSSLAARVPGFLLE
jgi:hypothetical protein